MCPLSNRMRARSSIGRAAKRSRFLEEGNKVKATMMFRGRQITHAEIGRDVLLRVSQELEDLGRIEAHPNLEGRNMTMILAPKKVQEQE